MLKDRTERDKDRERERERELNLFFIPLMAETDVMTRHFPISKFGGTQCCPLPCQSGEMEIFYSIINSLKSLLSVCLLLNHDDNANC